MKKNLNRELGLLDVFCIAAGAMISSGLFILPAIAFRQTGPAVVLAYLLAGLMIVPTMLAKAELATAMPRAGGTYFFIERSLGTSVGTIGGLASWFSLTFKTAFALVGIGVFAGLFYSDISAAQIKLIAVAFCLFFSLVNLTGVKHTGRIQIFLVIFLVFIILFYIFRGFLHIRPDRFTPFMPHGFSSLLGTCGLIFVSFGGLTKICSVAEEIKKPRRTIPLGMGLAFIVVMFLYAGAVFVTVGMLSPGALSTTLTPLSLGAATFGGTTGSLVLAFAGLLAFVSTANAGILSASRAALAMSRDYLLPPSFKRINAVSKTPRVAIITTTFIMIVIILFLDLTNLVKTASILMIFLFILVNFALIIMRESKIQNYRPAFKAPFYPWLQVSGILSYTVFLFMMGSTPLLIAGGFIISCIGWYFFYVRKRVNRRAALVHIIERITAVELVNPTLPDELREIIIERDELVEDRFDRLIQNCHIIDYEAKQSPSISEVLKKAAHLISKQLGSDEETVYTLLEEREKQTSTILSPGLAIPHIIVEGSQKFTILPVRCKKGILFRETDQPVHALFILAGSRDERNFHLRTLAAIAQIVQNRNFDSDWMKARNKEALRSIILLAERKRIGI